MLVKISFKRFYIGLFVVFCKLDVLFVKVIVFGIDVECLVDIGFIVIIFYVDKYFEIFELVWFEFYFFFSILWMVDGNFVKFLGIVNFLFVIDNKEYE